MKLGSQIVYKQLFKRHGYIRIPMIQRDYAQGRQAETEIREEFLNALWEALQKPADDPTLPLNLDFIYGSIEGEGATRFLPLDGQQRLTTLFLLHWYLAWQDEQWEIFEQLFQADQHSRFSYSVRPSSNEFFDEFVNYRPDSRTDDVHSLRQLISDQPWYFRSWRLDPTIQSVLSMLDAIHKRFASSTGLFGRIIDEARPAITFQLLNLENFGLSDDLYIKMNARGKPLTEFENFKARYEQELEKQLEGVSFTIGEQNFGVAQYVALKIDTAWTDLVWRLRDKNSNAYDGAFMNIFRSVVLVTRSPDNVDYLNDVPLLRNSLKAPSYSDFHSHGWLDEHFTRATISLLDAWSKQSGKFSALLPNADYFDERTFFDKILLNGVSLSYVEVVQFAAYVGFIARCPNAIDATAFQEWMRLVCNLSENTDYHRSDDLRRSIAGLNVLLDYSEDILKHFANSDNPASGFSPQQIVEEKLKAELILTEQTWRDLIERSEGHEYFRGQIGFLLDFSGASGARDEAAPDKWPMNQHMALQKTFLNYLYLAEQMFTGDGLKNIGEYTWQRALLSVGDYLLPSGRNYSFLVNRKDDQASWKRLLRGTGENVPEARKVLHEFWDKIDVDQSIEPQLESIIMEATDIDPWRAVLAQTPSAIEYCKNMSIRSNSVTEIYLLSKTQMNGAHAELFTFCLYQNSLLELNNVGRFDPLRLLDYYSAVGTDIEPGIQLSFNHEEHNAYFYIKFQDGRYKLIVHNYSLETWPEFTSHLKVFGFSEAAEPAAMTYFSEDIEAVLLRLAAYLAENFPIHRT